MTGDLALAVDIGGTRLRAALVERQGRVLHREVRATPAAEGADAVVTVVAEACNAVLSAAGYPGGLTLGLCSAGPLDPKRGIAVGTPTIRGFNGYPLREAVSRKLGLSVVIENDAPAAALGEGAFGAARGVQDFVYITISTGIGGGIVTGGRLLRGRTGLAGHVGHLPTHPGGATCACGQQGHWEAEASGSALQRKSRAAGFDGLESVIASAREGDATALGLVGTAADDLARGLVAIIHMTDPERIVVGGGVSAAFDLLAPKLTERLERLLLPAFRGVDLRKAALGDDSGLLGAALLALSPELRA